MPKVLDSFRFLLIAVAGWMNHHQLQMIEYLREENCVLRELLAGRRMRLNDDQRRRLAVRARGWDGRSSPNWLASSRPRLFWLGIESHLRAARAIRVKDRSRDRETAPSERSRTSAISR